MGRKRDKREGSNLCYVCGAEVTGQGRWVTCSEAHQAQWVQMKHSTPEWKARNAEDARSFRRRHRWSVSFRRWAPKYAEEIRRGFVGLYPQTTLASFPAGPIVRQLRKIFDPLPPQHEQPILVHVMLPFRHALGKHFYLLYNAPDLGVAEIASRRYEVSPGMERGSQEHSNLYSEVLRSSIELLVALQEKEVLAVALSEDPLRFIPFEPYPVCCEIPYCPPLQQPVEAAVETAQKHGWNGKGAFRIMCFPFAGALEGTTGLLCHRFDPEDRKRLRHVLTPPKWPKSALREFKSSDGRNMVVINNVGLAAWLGRIREPESREGGED